MDAVTIFRKLVASGFVLIAITYVAVVLFDDDYCAAAFVLSIVATGLAVSGLAIVWIWA
jgi:hypothetical protein